MLPEPTKPRACVAQTWQVPTPNHHIGSAPPQLPASQNDLHPILVAARNALVQPAANQVSNTNWRACLRCRMAPQIFHPPVVELHSLLPLTAIPWPEQQACHQGVQKYVCCKDDRIAF